MRSALSYPNSRACLRVRSACPRGSGRASFTDLMISAADTSVAVEAKFTEPIYQNVRSWLGEEANKNRHQVLRGWLDLIQRETDCTLELDSISSLPYQVIHRTASVCFMPGPVRTVTYLLFGNGHGDLYMKDLAAFSRCLALKLPFDFTSWNAMLSSSRCSLTWNTAGKMKRRSLVRAVKTVAQVRPIPFR